ncbi:MAG: Spy/CpxP family protein refolding chaperone [Candidatus Zixiibacteriota bacterium]|nr:MAG: Spy/CpxP family protein refolding chaperone [candidate division Zixibacteria bacterium]
MKKLLTLTLILTLAAATIAVAQPAPCPPGCCDGHSFGAQGKHRGIGHGMRGDAPGIKRILAMGDEINLTDQQRDQLENMMDEFRMEHVDRKAELQKAQIKLKALMRDEADEGEVNAAIDEVSELKAQMQKMRYANHQKAKSVLTQDQIDKLKQLCKDSRCGKGPKPGGSRRGPGIGG